ncbi:hypothetical protein J2128_000520 [Methanomicrobium sp. W14]|uniref:hypothetical protein n=1 Tax=Methanomicrobium sp. W14 TaxID=2817839 RepID=UPI001AEABF8E|nr:hypothetical protein [Methanomicrobium sp. W14]MBP2132599.1 hypothetical protein [Methanomicrobium sp. W14]
MTTKKLPKIYVLASVPNMGKTTTALLLEKHFKKEGKKVACLQLNKGQYDVSSYLEKGCYHYTMPYEAAKSKEEFEKWTPKGFDVYIFEITFAYSPMGLVFADLFENINEVIDYENKDGWEKHVRGLYRKWHVSDEIYTDDLISDSWKLFHDRNVQTVYTKSPVELKGPYVSDGFELNNPESFVFDYISPKYEFPRGNKKIIAVGAFPSEYRDIFPGLTWYRFDYVSFLERFRNEDYDLAIIGECRNNNLRFYDRPSVKNALKFSYPSDNGCCYNSILFCAKNVSICT